jgi:lysophospholipase L1-like esterase
MKMMKPGTVKAVVLSAIVGIGAPAALLKFTDFGSRNRVFVIAFALLLVPGIMLIQQWRAHRGKIALGILAGVGAASFVLWRIGDITARVLPVAQWIIQHRLVSAAGLVLGLSVTAGVMWLSDKNNWTDVTGGKQNVTAIGLGIIGGLALTSVLVVGLTWNGRYSYASKIVVPDLVRPVGEYVALGDSYASGEGLGPFFTSDNCHRSINFAFAELLTASGHPIIDPSKRFKACSGARSGNIYNVEQPVADGRQVEPGKGLIGPKTDLITIMMGGNDVHFSDVLKLCVARVDCPTEVFAVQDPAEDERADLTPAAPLGQWAPAMIDVVEKRLGVLLARLAVDAPNARILIVGYPQLLPAGRVARQFDVCDALVSAIDTQERNTFVTLQRRLNAGIANAASKTHRVEFIDPTDAFVTHEACGSRGELIHSTNLSKVDPGLFHPTAKGQQLLARTVACYLNLNPARPVGTVPKLSTTAKDSPTC